jgi:hypothetical protein
MLSKVCFQRNNMFLQFTLRLRVVYLIQFLDTDLLVQFKIITESVFGNSYYFRNILVQHSERFETDRIHAPLDDGHKMIVALIVDLFYNFWTEFELFRHTQILPNLLLLVS